MVKVKNKVISVAVAVALALWTAGNSSAAEVQGGIPITQNSVESVQSARQILRGAVRAAWNNGEIKKDDTVHYIKIGNDIYAHY